MSSSMRTRPCCLWDCSLRREALSVSGFVRVMQARPPATPATPV